MPINPNTTQPIPALQEELLAGPSRQSGQPLEWGSESGILCHIAFVLPSARDHHGAMVCRFQTPSPASRLDRRRTISELQFFLSPLFHVSAGKFSSLSLPILRLLLLLLLLVMFLCLSCSLLASSEVGLLSFQV